MVNFSPKSEKTQTSLSVIPNETNVIRAVPDVGFVMFTLNWVFNVE